MNPDLNLDYTALSIRLQSIEQSIRYIQHQIQQQTEHTTWTLRQLTQIQLAITNHLNNQSRHTPLKTPNDSP